jgi:enoyl-CoA hydratase/carnithine racemase
MAAAALAHGCYPRTMSTETPYETLELERDGDILRVWLNRPERLNAINTTMLREVGDLFGAIETDWSVRVVVLGGRGRSFCAGADRKNPPATPADVAATTDRQRRWVSQLGRRACKAIEECEAVTIARVQGHAVGGGSCFALSCDFRVAADDAIFRVPEVDLGVPLTWGATPRLLNELGAARTREVLLLCEDIDAARAHQWGMIHRVAQPADLDDEVDRLAEALAAKPEMAVYMTKTQLRGYARMSAVGDATETDSDMINVALRSDSARGLFAMPPKR